MTQPESLEQAFADVEHEASSALDSTKKLQSLLRQLHKSSREGNVAALKRVQGRLREASAELTRAVEGAAGSWLLGDEEEVGISEAYAAQLIRVAAEQGLASTRPTGS